MLFSIDKFSTHNRVGKHPDDSAPQIASLLLFTFFLFRLVTVDLNQRFRFPHATKRYEASAFLGVSSAHPAHPQPAIV